MKLAFLNLLLLSFLPAWAVLPDGAYPEWSFEKAWKRHSATRDEICLNGLWEFKSEPSLKHRIERVPVLEDPLEQATVDAWHFGVEPENGFKGKKSFDRTEKTTGEGSLRLDMEVAQGFNLYQSAFFGRNLPVGKSMTFMIDYKSELEGNIGKVEIKDAANYLNYLTYGGTIEPRKGWKTISLDFTVPGGTQTMAFGVPRVQPGGVKGTIWLDNLRIYAQEARPVTDCVPPASENWGYALVPGNWQDEYVCFWNDRDPFKKQGRKLDFGWFRRTIEIPADWSGRRFAIHFNRLGTHAVVFCNGKKAGTLGFLGGDVELTGLVNTDTANELLVMIESMDRWDVLPGIIGRPVPWLMRPVACGILGDVFLRSMEPAASQIGDVTIRTQVSGGKKLTVLAPLSAALSKNTGWRCELWRGVNLEKTFEGTLQAGTDKINITVDYPEAALWDINSPVLYNLKLALTDNGTILDQTLPQRFGFRQFEIRGKYFYLNDIKLNLNPAAIATTGQGSITNIDCSEAVQLFLTRIRSAGYNFLFMENNLMPGTYDCMSMFLRLCDEMGILAAITPLDLGGSWRLYHTDILGDLLRDNASLVIRNYINHPSLVMYRLNMNSCIYSQDVNPFMLDGKMGFTPGSVTANRAAVLLESNEFIRGLDPTRPNYNHACGNIGEIYTMNMYLGWPELQDLREWLKVWSEDGSKPLFMGEHAVPYPGDFAMRDASHFWQNEPLVTEYGAIHLGERAYELEEEDYVDFVKALYQGNGNWNGSYWHFCGSYPKIMDETVAKTYSIMYPYWRTWGHSGGMNVWENMTRRLIKRAPGSYSRIIPPPHSIAVNWADIQKPGRTAQYWQGTLSSSGFLNTLYDFGKPADLEYTEPASHTAVFQRLMARKFAFIGGPSERWYTVEHAFRSGENVQKTLILLNDMRTQKTFQINWECVMNGIAFAKGKAQEITVQPGENVKVPFDFDVPAVAARTEAVLRATVVCDGANVEVEPFDLQFFPHRAAFLLPQDFILVDPAGKTQAALERLGMQIPLWTAGMELPPNVKAVIVGESALDDDSCAAMLPALKNAAESGLQVLMLAQSHQSLEKLYGFRCFTPGIRSLHVRVHGHPVLFGLNDSDFSDWRGDTTLGPLPPLPQTLDDPQSSKGIWRCSREGVVASTVIEKPHTLAFIPLLDTGFDLRYTALFEVPQGNGRFIFCQLDLADRLGTDPVAETLVGNLLADMSKPRELPAAKVRLLERGCSEWLDAHSSELQTWLNEGNAIVAYGLTMTEGRKLASCTGNAFALAEGVNWLNPLKEIPPAPFSGLSVADIRWRKRLAAPVLSSAGPACWKSPTGVIGVIKAGKGSIVWLSASAADFPISERTDLVFSQVKTARLLQIVLANLGQSANWSSQLYLDKRLKRDDPYIEMRW